MVIQFIAVVDALPLLGFAELQRPGLSRANCLILIPESVTEVKAGSSVTILGLRRDEDESPQQRATADTLDFHYGPRRAAGITATPSGRR